MGLKYTNCAMENVHCSYHFLGGACALVLKALGVGHYQHLAGALWLGAAEGKLQMISIHQKVKKITAPHVQLFTDYSPTLQENVL